MFAIRPIVVIAPQAAGPALVMNKPPVPVNRQANHRSLSLQKAAGLCVGVAPMRRSRGQTCRSLTAACRKPHDKA
jgi:hypothetical protein